MLGNGDFARILDGSINVAKARDRLIEIANTRNGHDNVTVASIHCQAHLREDGNTFTELSVAPLDTPIEVIADSEDVPTDVGDDSFPGTTQFIQPPDKGKDPFSLLLKIVFLLGLRGVYLLIFSFLRWVGRSILPGSLFLGNSG